MIRTINKNQLKHRIKVLKIIVKTKSGIFTEVSVKKRNKILRFTRLPSSAFHGFV